MIDTSMDSVSTEVEYVSMTYLRIHPGQEWCVIDMDEYERMRLRELFRKLMV